MISAISHAPPPQPVAKTTEAAPRKPAPSKPTAPAAHADTVELSPTAQAALAAMQEATETPAQTAKEAGQGDGQAQRLLAKETAAKHVSK
jgi:hypothetical protein